MKMKKDSRKLNMVAIQHKTFLRSKGISDLEGQQLSLLFPYIEDNQDHRVIPNDYARSSLFTARDKRKPRNNYKNEELFHYNNEITIYYTGEELRSHDDEIIWLQILNYGRNANLGTEFEFDIASLIKEIGWSANGFYYDKVRESIARLKSATVTIINKSAYGNSGAISMISKYIIANDENGKGTHYIVSIDPSLILLFAGDRFTSLKWHEYKTLSPLARRLLDYLESHKNPYPIDLEKVKKITGSDNVTPRSWKQNIKKACEEITQTKLMTVYLENNKIVCQKIHIMINDMQNGDLFDK